MSLAEAERRLSDTERRKMETVAGLRLRVDIKKRELEAALERATRGFDAEIFRMRDVLDRERGIEELKVLVRG